MARKIVFQIASLRGGGAERVFVLVANELAARGHDVTLLAWNAGGPNVALLDSAVRLIDFDFPIHGESFSRPATLTGILRTSRTLRRLDPDVVFSAPEFVNLVAALALRLGRCRARFFPTFHAAKSIVAGRRGAELAVWLSSLVAARATKAVAVSAGVGRELVERGFPDSKVVVIHNPLPRIETPEAKSYPWEADLAAMGGGPVIVTAGRLTPIKDHRNLIDAFAQLNERQQARLVIFGEGPLEAELRERARAKGVADRVLFPGYVTDPRACYARADLFVLSSISEGFGNVLVEAMNAGVPVVSTNAPYGPHEILDNGRFGALTPVGDSPALARAMADMLKRPTAAELLKARAAEFDIERIGDRYEALLGSQPQPPILT